MLKNVRIISNSNLFKKILYIFYLLLLLFFFVFINLKIKKENKNCFVKISKEKDFKNSKFAIIKRKCNVCGLLSFYIVNLGFIHKYLLEGYIPIIDIKSFPNVFNGFNISKNNYWEIFFQQPFGYTLEEVLQNAKNTINISYGNCNPSPDLSLLNNFSLKNFWHNFANKYLSIKKEIIDLSKKIKYKLFKSSKNFLGVITRGTDYISLRPKGHPIPPNVSDLIKDINEMDNKYKYDYIFFSTEDEKIREKIEVFFKDKIKQLKPKKMINYDYSKKELINKNENIFGNIEFNKIYLLNVIILSQSLDIIAAQCSATVGIFILTNGFRNIKIYNNGVY